MLASFTRSTNIISTRVAVIFTHTSHASACSIITSLTSENSRGTGSVFTSEHLTRSIFKLRTITDGFLGHTLSITVTDTGSSASVVVITGGSSESLIDNTTRLIKGVSTASENTACRSCVLFVTCFERAFAITIVALIIQGTKVTIVAGAS